MSFFGVPFEEIIILSTPGRPDNSFFDVPFEEITCLGTPYGLE